MKPWLGLLALVAGTSSCAIYTIDLRIVDERGVAVPGATVVVSWSENSNDKVLADHEGRVRVRGFSRYNQAEISVEAANHYDSRLSLPKPYNCVERKCQIGTLDPVTVPLKRKLNPVPMYHYHIGAIPPDRSRPLDFDLVMADWVKPNGKGVVADLSYFYRCTIRNLRRFQAPTFEQARQAAYVELGRGHHEVARRRVVGGRAELLLPLSLPLRGVDLPQPELQDGYEIFAVRGSDLDWQGEARFNNPGDGLQFVPTAPLDPPYWIVRLRSDLESDHLAPETGYQAVWTYSTISPPKYEGAQTGYLRIRSRMGPDGRIVSAWYGKVYGQGWHIAEFPKLILDYYLNPDETRNVEYDPERNLGSDYTNRP